MPPASEKTFKLWMQMLPLTWWWQWGCWGWQGWWWWCGWGRAKNNDGCLIIIFIDDGDEVRFGLLTLCWKWTSVATGLAWLWQWQSLSRWLWSSISPSSTSSAIIIVIIIRPKAAYGRQGLAGSLGQNTDQAGTIWGVLNVLLCASGAQLKYKPTWNHEKP